MIFRWALAVLLLGLPLSTQAAMLSWPVEFNEPWRQVRSTFGPRLKTDVGYQFHTGIDIAGSTTDSVLATADGEVFRIYEEGSDNYPNAGNLVILQHSSPQALRFHGHSLHTYYTLYFHLNTINADLAEGDTVSAGDLLGTIGQTGNATYNHLHFEVRLESTCSLSSSCNTTGYEPHVHPLKYLDYPNANDVRIRKRTRGDQVVVRITSRNFEPDINKIKVNDRVLNFSTRRGGTAETNGWRTLKPTSYDSDTGRYRLRIQLQNITRLKVYDTQGDLVAQHSWN